MLPVRAVLYKVSTQCPRCLRLGALDGVAHSIFGVVCILIEKVHVSASFLTLNAVAAVPFPLFIPETRTREA